MAQRELSWRQVVGILLLFLSLPIGYGFVHVPELAFRGWWILGIGMGLSALLFLLDWHISKDLLPDVTWALDCQHVDQIGDAHVILIGRQTQSWATLLVVVQNTRLGAGVFELEAGEKNGAALWPLRLELEAAQVVLCVLNIAVAPSPDQLHVDLVLRGKCNLKGERVRRKQFDPIWRAFLSIPLSRKPGPRHDPMNALQWKIWPLWTIKERHSMSEIRGIMQTAVRDAGAMGGEVESEAGPVVICYRQGK